MKQPLPWLLLNERASAPRDGTAFLAYGQHPEDRPDMRFVDGTHVKAGDHWYAIILWDVFRVYEKGGQRWVYAKTGEPTYSDPTHWLALEPPDMRDLSHGLVYPRSPTTGCGDEP